MNYPNTIISDAVTLNGGGQRERGVRVANPHLFEVSDQFVVQETSDFLLVTSKALSRNSNKIDVVKIGSGTISPVVSGKVFFVKHHLYEAMAG